MSETREQVDLDILKNEIEAEMFRTYKYMVNLSKMDARGLEVSGHRGKTVAEAVLSALKSGEKRIKQLTDAHISKYPD